MAHNPLHTSLCDMLGVEYPIMSFNHCPDVAVAVANAGGYAVLGLSLNTPDECRERLQFIRSRTNKPFGADLLLPAQLPTETVTVEQLRAQIPQGHINWVNKLKAEFNIPEPKTPAQFPAMASLSYTRDQFHACLDSGIDLFAFALGTPAAFLQECKNRNIKTLSLVGNVRQARRVRDAGVEIIVAQGHDAGGHTGRIGTFTLVPQVVDAVSPTPVVAAGGVGDGRGLAAALCLGAVGTWSGTIWQTTHEHDLDIVLKQKLLEANEEDARVSRIYSGKTARFLYYKNLWAQAWGRPEAPDPLPMPFQGLLVADAMKAVEDYRLWDLTAPPAGQVVGMIKELKPARQVVLEMAEQAMNIMEKMAPTAAE